MIKRLKKIDYERYTVFIILLAMIPGSFGYMSWEAENVEVSILNIEGAPDSIVFIADPHLQEGNIEFIRESVGTINSLNPSVVLIGGDFVNGEESDLYMLLWEITIMNREYTASMVRRRCLKWQRKPTGLLKGMI